MEPDLRQTYREKERQRKSNELSQKLPPVLLRKSNPIIFYFAEVYLNNSTFRIMHAEPSPSAGAVFKVMISARLCAAIWSHITDCDETFNYWEPLHYLMYGQGLQTWEYSAEFSLRSYTYLLIHGVPGWIYKSLLNPNPMLVFYFIRCMLGVACACVECYFYK